MSSWQFISGAMADGRLHGAFADLPEAIQQRARRELEKEDPFVFFFGDAGAGMVAPAQGVTFSREPRALVFEWLKPAKGSGGVFIVIDGETVASWPYSELNIRRIHDVARFLAKRLAAPLSTHDAGFDV